ncbi:MAG: hypothetical protein ACXWNC_07165, partial [Anaerolineales bacterium]
RICSGRRNHTAGPGYAGRLQPAAPIDPCHFTHLVLFLLLMNYANSASQASLIIVDDLSWETQLLSYPIKPAGCPRLKMVLQKVPGA